MGSSGSAGVRRFGFVGAVLVLLAGVLSAATHDDGVEDVATADGGIGVEVDVTIPPGRTSLLPLPSIPTLPPLTLPEVTVLPTPPPTEPPNTGPPADPGGVFYVHEDGAPAEEVLQLSWTGQPLQRLTLPVAVDCCGQPSSSPDGSAFRVDFERYDRDGAPLGTQYGFWALDGVHTCEHKSHVPSEGLGQVDLYLIDGDNRERFVATLPTPQEGLASLAVSCDPARDRAVVFADVPSGRRTILVRLSDGAMTDLPPACSQGYGVSPDGRYLVVGSLRDGAAVCEIDTGEVVRELPEPGELTAGGTIITFEEDHCGTRRRMVVSDWRTGERLWSSEAIQDGLPCDRVLVAWRFHPTTGAFAIQVATTNEPSPPWDPGPVYVVDGHRPPVQAAASVTYSLVF